MDELTPTTLARPMDRAAMSNDMGILKNLLGLLNNPLLTGAEPPPSGPVADPQPQAKQEPMTINKINTRRIFLTGAARVGKSWLAQQIAGRTFELADPIQGLASQIFGKSDPALEAELFAWGSGVVSKASRSPRRG